MINQITLSGFKQFVISTFIIFIVFPNTIIAQHSYQDIVNRVDEIDSEMRRLTRLKEYIGMEFKEISDFSVQARPLLVNYRNYQKLIEQKKEERNLLTLSSPNLLLSRKKINAKTAEINQLIKFRDEYDLRYKKSGGLLAPTKVQCNSLEELQKEYKETTDYYLKQKTAYDSIKSKLGELNIDIHDLETKLKYMGDQSIGALDPSGCWRLAFGNHISEITIKKNQYGMYVGTLTLNNLQDYEDGQVVLALERVSDTTFKGIEYTWEEKPNGYLGEAKIPAMITINTDNNYITWTSDQTVTMTRCW